MNKYLSISGSIMDKTHIQHFDFEKNTLTTFNNELIYFNYLIGADGALSQVRHKLTGYKPEIIYGFESFQDIDLALNMPLVEFNYNQIGYNLIMPVNNTFLLGSYEEASKSMERYCSMVEQYKGNPKIKKAGILPSGTDIFLH
jgi:flavin-dependent dehydrogenase